MVSEPKFVRLGTRLALYSRPADAAFWDEQWHGLTESALRHELRPTGFMYPSYSRLFSRWLPRDGVILEAGCGTGHYVRRLRIRDYSCIGLDFAVPTLIRSKKVCSELPLVSGDVLRLPFSDNSLSGIVSLGVVEHFKVGPGVALKESSRVLRSGGVLCITVPYENRLLQGVPTVREGDAMDQGLEFYQYYFSQLDFKVELEKVGLHPITFRGVSLFQGLKRGMPLFQTLARFLPRPQAWAFAMELIPIPGFPKLASHMIFAVALKP